jgi:sensor histidine kinase YesM
MNKKLQILVHIAIWGVVLAMPLVLQLRSFSEIPTSLKVYTIVTNITLLILFYFSFLFISPYVIRCNSLLKSILLFIICGTAIYSIKLGLLYYLDTYYEQAFSNSKLFSFGVLIGDFTNSLIIMAVALLIRISTNWFRDQKTKADLLLQQQTQELALLKAQVNPHFFFNTLNNIYSLVYRKSDDAPAALLKLSEIMRYMLYDSKTDTVPLPKELEHLESYLELEKLRLRDPDFISYNVEGDADGMVIPPMLLLSFVENAFKHGKKRVKTPGITINIKIENNKLNFMIANYTLAKQNNGNKSGGIGLKNITRRLELLYPGSHSLHILNESDQYVVNLELRSNPIKNK